jgi:hypothetical protein
VMTGAGEDNHADSHSHSLVTAAHRRLRSGPAAT